MASFKVREYKYVPLNEAANEIRLLTILPSKSADEPVHTTLKSTSFTEDNVPEFEALSYTWGSPADPVDICIRTKHDHDQDENTAFEALAVTQNLGKALPYLRYTDKPRVVWIDAICVNQQDLEERSKQVLRMTDIYTIAQRVVVWLGEESHTSKHAISTLKDLSAKVKVDWRTYTMAPTSPDPAEAHWADQDLRPPFDEFTWDSITDLLGHSWFGRLWIWQEIQLASQSALVACGSHTILWQDFRTAIFCLTYKPSLGEVGKSDTHTARRELAMSLCMDQRLAIITRVLESTRLSQCTDPRDRVYALLSLFWNREVLNIRPDYTKTAGEVYQEFVSRMFDASRSIDILNFCEWTSERLNIPSWVPDLSNQKLTDAIELYPLNASSLSRPPRISNGVLDIQGVIIGTLQKVQTSELTLKTRVDDVLLELVRLALKFNIKQLSRSGTNCFESFVRTMNNNLFADYYDPPRYTSYRPVHPTLDILEKLLINGETIDARETEELGSYLGDAQRQLSNRCLFSTKEGSFGLGPASSQPNDYVVQIVGCRTPLILRTRGDVKTILIGEAYCHGAMLGEPFLGPLPPEFEYFRNLNPKDGDGFMLFQNRETGQKQTEDPRLGELPEGWERKVAEGFGYPDFVDTRTGEVFDGDAFDPRVTPEELVKRGVKLRDFEIS